MPSVVAHRQPTEKRKSEASVVATTPLARLVADPTDATLSAMNAPSPEYSIATRARTWKPPAAIVTVFAPALQFGQ